MGSYMMTFAYHIKYIRKKISGSSIEWRFLFQLALFIVLDGQFYHLR